MKTQTLAFLLISIISFLLAACQQEPPPPPNVVFIAVDDLRPELGCYGNQEIISPSIDRLAAEGLLFQRAYCNVPVCGASRASLLTGVRPSRERFVTYRTWAEKETPDAISLPAHFKRNGYHTASLGKVFHHLGDMADSSWSEAPWHPGMCPGTLGGWRNYLVPSNIATDTLEGLRGMPYEIADVADSAYFDGKTALKAIAKMEEFKGKNKPFFLAVGFLKPHLPFNAPRKYWDLYKKDEVELAPNPQMPSNAPKAAYHNFGELRNYAAIPPEGSIPDTIAKKLVHGYRACVSYTDAQIGKLLDALEEKGLAENTIVVLWGDHGWQLGEHGLWCKHSTFHNAINAPLIVKDPRKKGGTSTRALTEFVDIYPTMCELAGLEKPSHLDGQSFVSLFEDPSQQWKDAVFSRYHDAAAIRTDRYVYTEWFDRERNSYARMLYDHQVDPAENHNIAELPENRQLVATLSQRLSEMEQEAATKSFENKTEPAP